MLAPYAGLLSLVILGIASFQDATRTDKTHRKTIVHQVVPVSGKEVIGPAEVSVAINPIKPDEVRAISFTHGGSTLYTSDDGGLKWTSSRFPQTDNTRMQGDDLLVYDAQGNLHHACIRFTGIRTKRPSRAGNGIFTHRYLEGKWSPATPVVDHVNTVEPFEDKPWLAIDNSASSHKGNVYVSWTRFDEYGNKDPDKKSHLYFSRSTNGRAGYQPVIRVSDTPGDCVDSSQTIMGGMPAVGPKGQVYVVWSGPVGIMLDRSLDGGVTFGKDVQVQNNPGGWDQPVAGTMRANGLPVIGVDHSTGPRHGTIYVTWADTRHGDLDIFCCSSSDQGATWTQPVRVNNDPQKNGKLQFFPWMSVDPADGSVNVLFYDRRDEEGMQTTMTMARSIDGGKTFVNYAINQPAFTCSDKVFFGDYIGIAAHHGKLVAVYSYFKGKTELALSAAVFKFKPGTQEVVE
ncbi:MAG: exo-alpha-sialidase [Planctomycetia bacterium]|nr:exo-alpha-sialidase [Planctomycetia bacterium]